MFQAGGAPTEIADDAGLLRRIHPTWVVWDMNLGSWRVSSAAFKDPRMSVDAEPLLIHAGLDWAFSLRDFPDHSLVRLRAGVLGRVSFMTRSPITMLTLRCAARRPRGWPTNSLERPSQSSYAPRRAALNDFSATVRQPLCYPGRYPNEGKRMRTKV